MAFTSTDLDKPSGFLSKIMPPNDTSQSTFTDVADVLSGSSRRTRASRDNGSESPVAARVVAPAKVTPTWQPRSGATYLSRGASGVWYARITVPSRLRAAHPHLPKEMRRSTDTANLRIARARARQMCADFLALPQYQNHSTSARSDAVDRGFSIIYADGGLRIESAPGADAATLILLQKCVERLVEQVVGEEALPANKPIVGRKTIDAINHLDATLQTQRDRSLSGDLSSAAQVLIAPSTGTDPVIGKRSFAPVAEVTAPSAIEPNLTRDPAVSIWLSDAVDEWRSTVASFSTVTWDYAYASSFRLLRELTADQRRNRSAPEGVLQTQLLDVDLRTFSRSHIRSLLNALKRLPPRQGQRDDKTEAPARIAAAVAANAKPMTPANVEKKLRHVQPFLLWCKQKGYVGQHVLDELSLVRKEAHGGAKKAAPKDAISGSSTFVALSECELRNLFESDSFRVKAIRHDWAYWCPLMCLHLGLRISEATSIHVSDIVTVEGHACLTLTASTGSEDEAQVKPDNHKPGTPNRRLKTSSSRRTVPIHPMLITLGFLAFVDDRRRAGASAHLFPDLPWEEKHQWSRKLRELTAELLKQVGAHQPRRKVPHSLRSNFIQALKRTGLPDGHVERFVGHATGKMADEHYAETDQGPYVPAALIVPFLARVDFKLNLPDWQSILAERQEQ